MSDVENMLRFHLQGLQRVCRVIDKHSNYDGLMEHRLGESHWAVFQTSSDIAEKRAEAIALFEKKFRQGKAKAIVPVFAGFVCEGSSPNNVREFEFFERICAPFKIEILKKNYSNCDRVSFSDLTNEQAKARDAISSDVESFYAGRDDITASLVRQQILYSQAFFNFLLAFSRQGAVRPSALVQANDHSPVRVALSMIMKGLEIPRIYLQHAEVTQNFPELDFEYSVLRNARSHETYEAIGPIKGQVFVIAREETAFARERLLKAREGSVTVGIYPSSRVLVDELIRVIAELRKNPEVSKVVIKQHPAAASALDGVLGQSGVEFSKEIPREDHVAIVGNSAVVIELLHRGIPVYQNFDSDPTSADYYGFVARGLTYSCAFSDLSGRFWRNYPPTEGWIDMFAKWNPTAAEGHLDEQTRFVNAMARIAKSSECPLPTVPRPIVRGRMKVRAKTAIKRTILATINSSPRLSAFVATQTLTITGRLGHFLLVNTHNAIRFFHLYTGLKINAPVWQGNGGGGAPAGLPQGNLLEILEYTLANLDRPSEWLLLNERIQAFTPLAMILTLDRMFQNRNPSLNAVFRDHSASESNSAVAVWLDLKKAEWGNIAVDESGFDRISRFIYGYEDNARVRAILESMLLAAIIRCSTCERLDEFWTHAKTRQEGLSINRKIDVLRKLRSAPDRQTEADQLQQLFERTSTPFEVVKLRNMEFMEGRQNKAWTHLAAEREFRSTAPRQVVREFETHVAPVYDRLRPQMRFMEVRTGKSQAYDLRAQVRQALVDRKPFSLLRLSDSEGYLFPERRFFTEADAANRERHWWGVELPAELRDRIIAEAREAVMGADVVGIPSIYRLIRDNDDKSTSLFRSLQGRGLVEVLAGTTDVISPSAALTEDKVNVALFTAVETLAELARIASKVIVVTSAKAESLPRELVRNVKIDVINIPTHHKTALNEAYHTGPEPLPFVYPSILDDIDRAIEPGALVLIAGGLVGKIFIGRARARGAVAIDIGHTLDDWMHPQLPSLR